MGADGVEWRYERKFSVPDLNLSEAEMCIRLHPAMFAPIYQPRAVNNVYFDDLAMSSFIDNVEGVSARKKVRVRWYGSMFGEHETRLEFKIKSGQLGRKESWALPKMSMHRGMSKNDINAALRRAELPDHAQMVLRSREPILANRYSRKYFLSSDRKFRLTLDHGLEWYHLGPGTLTFLHRCREPRGVVLEVKYAREHDDEVEAIARRFPFRVTRSSKYVTGIQRVHPFGSR